MPKLTWEEAVEWLRQQPDQVEVVRACYFDDPLLEACERFAQSGEWHETARYLPSRKGRALDIGAGRGITSYALAKDGWQVTALEPDPSSLVGADAIRRVAREADLPIEIVVEWGESLPFTDNTFDVVCVRQVLHHARDLKQLCMEVGRVLKPSGVMIATREHVISRRQDLQTFLAKHDLHHLYEGEHAYLLDEYLSAIRGGGLTLQHVWGIWESEINYFPTPPLRQIQRITALPKRFLGQRITEMLTAEARPWGAFILKLLARIATLRDKTPGRMYSFVAKK